MKPTMTRLKKPISTAVISACIAFAGLIAPAQPVYQFPVPAPQAHVIAIQRSGADVAYFKSLLEDRAKQHQAGEVETATADSNTAKLKKDFLAKHHTSKDDIFFVATSIDIGSYNAGFYPEKYKRKVDASQYTHYTPNSFSWKAMTHKRASVNYARFIGLDVDLPSPDAKSRNNYQEFFAAKCDEHGIQAFSVLRTPNGYHILFALKFPATNKHPHGFGLAEEAERELIEVFQADPQHAGLNGFYRLPDKQTQIIDITGRAGIDSCSELLRRLRKPITKAGRRIALPKPIEGPVMAEGSRNNTAFTFGMICRSYGRDKDFAVDLINRLGGCESEAELIRTVNSAYTTKHHARNDWVRRLCMGSSVSDVARKYGIYEGVRKFSDEELYEFKKTALLEHSLQQTYYAQRRIIQAIKELRADEVEPSIRRVAEIAGISKTTVLKYSYLLS